MTPPRPAAKDGAFLIIAGADTQHRGSIQHEDDFRLFIDGVLMNRTALKQYYANQRSFPDRERLVQLAQSAPRRQVYFVGLYLYALLRRNGFDAEVINCHLPGSPDLAQALARSPMAVIISTSFLTADDVAGLVRVIRESDPDVPIIVGGRWVWYSYRVLEASEREPYRSDEVRRRYFFTRSPQVPGVTAYVVAPGGEATLLELLGRLRDGHSWDELPNLAIPEDGRLRWNARREEDIEIGNLTIDWSLIPTRYTSTVLPMALSLGCPFRCSFCNFAESGYRRKTLDCVRQELRNLAEHQRLVSSVWFIDDNILTTPHHAREFCRMMRDEQYPFTWRSFMRADVVTEETIDDFADSNCELLILGLESVDDRVLRAMNKRAAAQRYREAVRLLAQAGISAELSFIVGFPPEDDSSIGRLQDFLAHFPPVSGNAVYYLFLFLFHLEPLAPIFEAEARDRYGLRGFARSWRHDTMDAETAMQKIREIYLSADSSRLFLNYLDCHPSRCSPEDRRIMTVREEYAKAVLSGSAERNRLDRLLESLVFDPSTASD
jgi:p-methyltransferase